MSLTRKEIRHRIVEALQVLQGVKIYSGRFQPTDCSEVPFIRVCTLNEESELLYDDSFRRTLTLTVLIYQDGAEELDDDLDDLSEKVEQILLANPLRGEIQQIQLKSMRLDASSSANRELGCTELTFEILYDWYLTINPTTLCAVSGQIETEGLSMEFEEKLNE